MKPGDILDSRYEILERLGAGGMGEVYKAKHTLLGSTRVIKIIHPHISSSTDAHDRFLREARAATKVQHSNVATLHDFASLPDGAHYMVWEYIDGENLAQRLRARGTLPPRQAVRIAVQALRGLDAIHRAGIVHRDISPENLMITRDDEVKIIDLGVAKIEDSDAVSQTRTGIFVGKLRYAAPEQLGFLPDGERIDGRADLYALAMVVVELLTGRPPYEAKSPHEYFLHHARDLKVTTVVLPPSLPGSAALQQQLERALSRDRNDRFASARDFAGALEEIERTLPDPRDMPTMAVPFDGDETLKVGGEYSTVRTPAAAAPTEPYTDAPLAPAEPTIRTPLPEVMPSTPAAKRRAGLHPIFFVLFIALILGAVGAYALWTQVISPAPKEPEPAKKLAAVTPSKPQPATSTVDVAAATNTTPLLTQPKEVPQVVKPIQEPAPLPKPQPEPEPEPEPETRRERRRSVALYIDGPGRQSGNERALDRLREDLQGVNTIALRAGSMQVEVYRAIKRRLPNLVFESEADVVIRFDGTAERLRREGRHLSAAATIEKGGEVIFRYEVPGYVDRGAAADAFASTIAEAFE